MNACVSLRPATEIRVLGPLEVVGAEGVVALTAAKERLLLVSLLIDPGKVRSPDSLIEALWGASPPRSAPKLLQVYVSKLRKSLPAPVEIRTRDAGYMLEISGGLIDSVRFERLLDEGREAGRAGNHALAGSLLRRGLALWRGPAFGDLAYEEVAHAEAERLEELRLVASEERIAAELAVGLHVELLPELQVLARAHPLRERLQAQAMLALYRAGHQADALEVYRSTRALLANDLGLEPEAELRDLHQRILRHDPSLAVPDAADQAPPASLPVPPNPLRGRERELRDLHELLSNDDVRLLVLTGAGGSGKTRLAIAAARESAASFSNGAVLVELAPLREPDHLLGAISNALGIQSVPGAPIEALSEALGSREELLVLDNIEHLRPAVGGLVELLARAPRLKLLVTSRVVLHVSGEHVYPVDPLPVDAAVALFLERARGADARFDPDTAEVRTIEHICDRLDRLPLAIELAASRVRSLTPSELAGRLEARLTLLAGGPRDLPARQQTLRATLEWSFELLGADERDDLVRLSVFAGGCDLAAAEAVVGTTFERVSTLVDHNLLVRTVGEYGSRYSLLETIREFAAERLEASGEAEELRRRHAEYALVVADSLGLSVDESSRWVEERHGSAAVEQDNMRAALDWALEADPELGLELAVALEQFWITTNPAEGADRIGALLERSGDCSPSLRARALRDLGGCIQISGGGVEAANALRGEPRDLRTPGATRSGSSSSGIVLPPWRSCAAIFLRPAGSPRSGSGVHARPAPASRSPSSSTR